MIKGETLTERTNEIEKSGKGFYATMLEESSEMRSIQFDELKRKVYKATWNNWTLDKGELGTI